VNPALQYGTALISAALIATAISCVTQLTGPQTALRGMKAAALLWLGFVLTTWATEYVFEVRTYALFAINTGFWLIGMVVMGAIVGAWKKQGPKEQGTEGTKS
jgi:xanthine/uracil permease